MTHFDVMNRYQPVIQIIKGFLFTSFGFWLAKDQQEWMIWFFLALGVPSVLNMLDNALSEYSFDEVVYKSRFSWKVRLHYSSIDHLMFNMYTYLGFMITIFVYFDMVPRLHRFMMYMFPVITGINGLIEYRRLRKTKEQPDS